MLFLYTIISSSLEMENKKVKKCYGKADDTVFITKSKTSKTSILNKTFPFYVTTLTTVSQEPQCARFSRVFACPPIV